MNDNYNDELKLIDDNLFGSETHKRLTSNKYVILIEYITNLFKSNIHFTIGNNIVRHILINGDITLDWNDEIIIYLNEKDIHIEYVINSIVKIFAKNNVKIIEKNKENIKFLLNVLDKEYIFVIKEKNKDYAYDYYFEINQLEYDINKRMVINNVNNGLYKINDEHILNLRNLDFFSDLENDDSKDTKYKKIIKFLSINPSIIFELVEMSICFSNFLTVVEVKNFLINLNHLIEKRNTLTKTLKKILDSDNDFLLYKKMIVFSYSLDEKGLFGKYIKYIFYKYTNFINLIVNIDIDKELFDMFDIKKFRDFACLLVFQHLIYNKRKIFKQKKITYDADDSDNSNNVIDGSEDLLSSFIDKYKSDTENDNNFDMLDKQKFSSLKYLKITNKTFIKFEDLIKMISFKVEDELYIKNFYNINMLLFAKLKDIIKHHSLKIAYIIKKFHFVNKDLIIKSMNIFNTIVKNKKYNETLIIKPHFINMVSSNNLSNFIYKKMTMIPTIKEQFKNNLDCIDITDFQDSFIFFIDFLYRNKLDYNEDEPELNDYFESIFEASLCDMRSYRIFKNEKRRKKEKKMKKEMKLKKKEEKEKKNKYKIMNKKMESLEEQSEEETDSLDNSDSEGLLNSFLDVE